MAAGVSPAARLLGLWEEASGRLAPERAARFASRARDGIDLEAAARLPLGARDRLVLALRAAVIGGPIVALGDCPSCGQTLEVELDPDAMLASGPVPVEAAGVLDDGDVVVRFRPPTSLDMLAVLGAADVEAAAGQLLARCVTEARDGERPLGIAELSPRLRERIDEALEALDPDAVIEIAIACTGCGERFSRGLDPGEFLVRELAAAGRRTLREVHALAAAYGWTETEILALGERRRRWYLELAAG